MTPCDVMQHFSHVITHKKGVGNLMITAKALLKPGQRLDKLFQKQMRVPNCPQTEANLDHIAMPTGNFERDVAALPSSTSGVSPQTGQWYLASEWGRVGGGYGRKPGTSQKPSPGRMRVLARSGST